MPPSLLVAASQFQFSSCLRRKLGRLLVPLVLAASPGMAAVTGNLYDLGNGNSAVVSPVNAQWVTFTAMEDGTVTEAQINNSTAPTGSPTLEVGLYAVDALGVPTGSALSSGTVTASATGWQTTALNYSLVKGTVYALRVSTTTVGASFPWRLNFASATNNVQPSGAVDTHWMRGFNNGAPSNGSQNVWILKTGTNQAIGQPYTVASNQNLGSNTLTIGERFRFDLPSTGENLLTSVSLKLNVSATPPANPLTIKLLDKNGLVLTTGSIDLSTAAAGVAYFNVGLAAAQELTAGEFYYLALYSNGSVSNSVAWSYASTTNDPLYQSATYQGVDAYAVSWGSQTNYSTAPSTDLSRDYFFQLNLDAVPEPSTWALVGLGLIAWMGMVRNQRFQKRK